MKNYRYPGTRPFEEQDSHLFFGRTQDIEKLYNRIVVEKMTVLHGKSGLGKTSLLQAGILPKLHQDSDYQAFTIRFRAYQEGYFVEPVETLKESVNPNPTQLKGEGVKNPHPFGEGQGAGWLFEDDSLWALFKRQNSEGKKRFILFFDQFEELFTYPDLSVRLFKSMFGELLNGTVPKKTQKRLQDALQKGEMTESEYDEILAPLDLKVVFAIRSDRMSLLDRMTDKIPSMLRNLYELKPLELEQAKEALLTPAALGKTEEERKKYNFATEAFEYEPDAVRKILNFLSKNNTQKIESFQLQIFCRWAEEFSDRRKDYLIETHDVGDPNLIFENYYETQIQTLPAEQQLTARELIEDDLIYEKEERRLSLYEGVILDKIKDTKLLSLLVNTRLLRAEPVQDGFAYEISHDTLVSPILKSKKLRVAERLRIEEEQRQAEELQQAREKAEKDRIEAQKTAKTLRTVRSLLAAALVALILAVGAVFYAFQQTEIAKSKEQEAKKAQDEALKNAQEAKNAQALAVENEKKAVAQESQTKTALADAQEQKRLAQTALGQAQTEKQRAQNALSEVQKAQAKTLELLADIGKRELDNANSEINKVQTEKAYNYLKTAASISQDEQVQDQIVQTLCEIAFIELHQNTPEKWASLKSLAFLAEKRGKIQADFSQKQGVLQAAILKAQKMSNKTQARNTVLTELEKKVGKEKVKRLWEKYYPMKK